MNFALCIADIVAVSYKDGYNIHITQVAILALSFLTFIYGLVMVVIHFPVDYPIPPHMFTKHKYIKGTDREGKLVIQQVTVRPIKPIKNSDKKLDKKGSFFLDKHVTTEIQKRSKSNCSTESDLKLSPGSTLSQVTASTDTSENEQSNETNIVGSKSIDDLLDYDHHDHDDDLTAEFKVMSSTVWDRIAVMCLDKEAIIEFLCYLMGFSFIYVNDGISSLRVFRMFRFLSYLKVCVYADILIDLLIGWLVATTIHCNYLMSFSRFYC